MITGHMPAVRLPAGDAAGCVAVAVPARGILEERGDTAVTSPAPRTAVFALCLVEEMATVCESAGARVRGGRGCPAGGVRWRRRGALRAGVGAARGRRAVVRSLW